MRIILLLFFLVFSVSYSQNKQILYDFAGLPQTLLLNPGAKVSNKYHIGVPLVSQISVQAGFTGFSAYDIFADNGIDINDKIKKTINNLGNTEFAIINEQIDIINAGFRLANNSYLSFGYYQEFDFLSKIPKDLVDLFYEGNSEINKKYSINKLTLRAELLGVFHIGLSKKINKEWQVGARAKIYSSVFNASSKSNSGEFYTDYGTNNIYKQYLENVDASIQTSGVFFDDYDDVTSSYIKSSFLLGGNLGLGLDLGFTHNPEKQWTISGSVLDLGFIYNTKNVESYKIKGDYEVEGLQLIFDPNSPENYWSDLKEDFDEQVVLDTLYSKYISLRPVKLNGSVSYSFGQNYDDCRFLIDPQSYINKVGMQLFSTIGSVHSYVAATLFYERKLTNKIQSKFTYTIDPFSFANIGVGLSMQLGPVNTYFAVDNLLNLNNIYNTKSASIQLGLNVIVNHKK